MSESRFGTIAQKIGDNQYAVIISGGQRIEATWYRTDYMLDFGPGDQVFVERVGGSGLWMISSYAFGNPGDAWQSGGGSLGWFTVDHDVMGLVDGPGRIMP